MTENDIITSLEFVLDRKTEIDTLTELRQAITTSPQTRTPLGEIALGIDTCVFLRIGKHAKSADIVDYLSSRHAAPLIIPGQAIQEFWNNHLHTIDTHAAAIKKKHEELKKVTQQASIDFTDYHTRMESVITDFEANYGYIYDDGAKRRASNVLDTLKDAVTVPYAPRSRFAPIAANRKRTKTPPGFKDDLDGDFYIWLDFLYGLIKAKHEGKHFTKVVLITDDGKIDWSRAGMAHPILSAEIRCLLNIPFETWSLDKLSREIGLELQAVGTDLVNPTPESA